MHMTRSEHVVYKELSVRWEVDQSNIFHFDFTMNVFVLFAVILLTSLVKSHQNKDLRRRLGFDNSLFDEPSERTTGTASSGDRQKSIFHCSKKMS